MITKAPSWITSDQQTFAELDAAIGHEIQLLMDDSDPPLIGETIPAWIMANRDRLVDLLTTTKTSKPRARKINGASKKRTPRPDAAAVNRELQDGKQ